MLISVLVSVLCASVAFAGTPCPPREDIYPCSCANLPLGKNLVSTLITCHKLQNTGSLSAIFDTLRSMQIDHFYLYDSFWEANPLGTVEGENQQVLPADWMTLLRIKELEIVDTTLSACFACHGTMHCKNSVTTRFAVVNSSSSEKICTICEAGRNQFSWTGCLGRLREFRFTHGRMSTLRADLFPVSMPQLLTLNLTYNRITKVEAKALSKLVRLKSLDLSHNALQSTEAMFSGQESSLEFLDLSFNMIKSLGNDLFKSMPYLKRLDLDNNLVVDLKETEWRHVPSTLRNIDLRENPLHCNCSVRWVNQTFHINVNIVGFCATPEDYENSPLRRASRLLNERCSEEGVLGTRPPKATTAAPLFRRYAGARA